MYFLVGALIGLLGMLFTHMWTENRDLRRVVRAQGDELSRLGRYMQDIQMMVADVIAQSQKRQMGQMKSSSDLEYLKAQAQLRKDAQEGLVLPMEESRPGEVDQRMLL